MSHLFARSSRPRMTLFYLAPSYIARQTEQQSAYEDRIAELVRQDLPPAVLWASVGRLDLGDLHDRRAWNARSVAGALVCLRTSRSVYEADRPSGGRFRVGGARFHK